MSSRKLAPQWSKEAFPPQEGPTQRDVFDEDRELGIEPVSIVAPDEPQLSESGLSVDPEELGRLFLRDALQQHNDESERRHGFEADELELQGVELELQSVDWDAKTEPDVRPPAELGSFRENTDLDLSLPAIHDASLFDQPLESDNDDADELATRVPHIRADDVEDRPQLPLPRRVASRSRR